MKTIWEKMPSVTAGGKPYFWTTKATGGHGYFKVVWDRFAQKWVLTLPDDSTFDYYDSDTKAKKAYERIQKA